MTYKRACVMSESEVIELDADDTEMRFLYHQKDKNSGSYAYFSHQNARLVGN